MTDPTDQPRPADGAWFHAHVDPILDAEPVPDAWAAIEARAHGDVPETMPRRALQGRWLAIAAVLALLAGLAVVVAVTLPDHDTTTVTANEPEATGWYIPTGLPEGWTLRTAWVTKRPRSCGHTRRSWEGRPGPGGTPRLDLTYVRCGDELPPGQPGPALGPGIDESVIQAFPSLQAATQLHWLDDGGWSLVAAGGLTQDDLITAAKAVVANPASMAPPLEGLGLGSTGRSNGPLPGPTVAISLETPDGQIASYRLAAPGVGPRPTPFTKDTPVGVAGQPLPVELRTIRFDDLPARAEPLEGCCRGASSYLGTWPGAELQVPRSNFTSDDAGKEPGSQAEYDDYDDSLLELIGSLRPATTDEWRAFLATASDRPSARLFRADELTDVSTPPKAPTGATTTTTTSPNAAEPDDGTRGYRSTYPGTPVPRDDEDDRLTPLDGLEISLEVANLHNRPEGPTLAIGEVAPAKLIVHNTSDEPAVLTECTLAFTRWGLVNEADRSAPLPEPADGGCSAFPEETVPAGGTIRLPMDWSRPAGFVSQRPAPDGSGRFLGSLRGGAYFATVEVPGRDSDLRLQIPVDVINPPCRTSDDDVAPYLGLPASQARALAKRNGMTLSMATLDGDPVATHDDTRCDRVNVDVWLSEVVNAYVS